MRSTPPGDHLSAIDRSQNPAAIGENAPVRYNADITAGALKVPESRVIADLLLRRLSTEEWKSAIEESNLLQARSRATAIRLARLLRQRLEAMDSGLWRLVRDGSSTLATHACLAAAVKHSRLLGDFLDTVVREELRIFAGSLSRRAWEEFLEACAMRDPGVAKWNPSTVTRLRSTVFQILAQAGYLESTRTMRLQRVHIASEVLSYLRSRDERYVLRCIQMSP